MLDQLPDYERHPLDETVMGVQFEPLKTFGFQHLFQYWSQVRERYPRIEEQALLPHAIEALTLEPRKEQPTLLISGSQVPLSRFWLIDATTNQLIQIQNDRFLRNWRLRDGSEIYPRFNVLFGAFWQEWGDFQAFLREERIDGPKVDQCELTYVNYINTDEMDRGLAGLENAFSVFRIRPEGFLPAPEFMKWESSYALPDEQGRLRVSASPFFRQRDFKLVVNYTLSARGKPTDLSNEQIMSWFDMAHEWIVRAFDELTTPEMHRVWKKKP